MRDEPLRRRRAPGRPGRSPWPRRVSAAAAVLVLAGAPLTACGVGDGGVRPVAGEPAGSGAATPGGVNHRADVRVGLTEWTIHASRADVPSGTVQVAVTNAGGTEHDLVVTGEAGTWRTGELDPGERETLVVEARPGERLRLACSQPGHFHDGVEDGLVVGP